MAKVQGARIVEFVETITIAHGEPHKLDWFPRMSRIWDDIVARDGSLLARKRRTWNIGIQLNRPKPFGNGVDGDVMAFDFEGHAQDLISLRFGLEYDHTTVAAWPVVEPQTDRLAEAFWQRFLQRVERGSGDVLQLRSVFSHNIFRVSRFDCTLMVMVSLVLGREGGMQMMINPN